jgi:hypothetical protein
LAILIVADSDRLLILLLNALILFCSYCGKYRNYALSRESKVQSLKYVALIRWIKLHLYILGGIKYKPYL